MESFMVFIFNGLVAAISTIGFALFMQTPRKSIVQTGIVGGMAWMLYLVIDKYAGTVAASFLGACLVALLGEVFARIYKHPSIVYILSGIIPLAPGRNLYYTMENIIFKNYSEALHYGTTTLAIAGAISLGILLITSSARTISLKKDKQAIASE